MTDPNPFPEVERILRGQNAVPVKDKYAALRYMESLNPASGDWNMIYCHGNMEIPGGYRFALLSTDMEPDTKNSFVVLDKLSPQNKWKFVSVMPAEQFVQKAKSNSLWEIFGQGKMMPSRVPPKIGVLQSVRPAA